MMNVYGFWGSEFFFRLTKIIQNPEIPGARFDPSSKSRLRERFDCLRDLKDLAGHHYQFL